MKPSRFQIVLCTIVVLLGVGFSIVQLGPKIAKHLPEVKSHAPSERLLQFENGVPPRSNDPPAAIGPVAIPELADFSSCQPGPTKSGDRCVALPGRGAYTTCARYLEGWGVVAPATKGRAALCRQPYQASWNRYGHHVYNFLVAAQQPGSIVYRTWSAEMFKPTEYALVACSVRQGDTRAFLRTVTRRSKADPEALLALQRLADKKLCANRKPVGR